MRHLTVVAAMLAALIMSASGTASASSCQITSKDGKKHCSVSCPRKSDTKNHFPYARCLRARTAVTCSCTRKPKPSGDWY